MSGERSFRVLIPAGRVEGGPTPSEDSESSTLCRLSRAGSKRVGRSRRVRSAGYVAKSKAPLSVVWRTEEDIFRTHFLFRSETREMRQSPRANSPCAPPSPVPDRSPAGCNTHTDQGHACRASADPFRRSYIPLPPFASLETKSCVISERNPSASSHPVLFPFVPGRSPPPRSDFTRCPPCTAYHLCLAQELP